MGAGLGRTFEKGAGAGGRMFGGPDDESIYRILRALATFGSIGTSTNPSAATVEFQDQVSQLPGKAQETLRNALASLAEQGKSKKLDEGVLVQLAEHLSIRFALEQFDRGEVKVNAVRQMLDRMNQEIEHLRNILGQHEDKMAEAGILVESHREMLDRVFWASVPESAKREVLLSGEAWCIPPKNVQSYVAELLKQGEIADAVSILQIASELATIKAQGKLLHGGLRQMLQDARQAGRHASDAQSLFHELRHPLLNPHLRAEGLPDSGTLPFDCFHRT